MRSKTGEYGRYIVPVNLDKWWLCFGHALATQIILSSSIDDQLFCNISQSRINGCFKAIYSRWLKSAESAKPYNYTNNMTVHSLRVLGMQALKKKKIPEHSSSARGGWSKGSGEVKKRRRDAKLNYQRYDEEDDLECAKILAFLSLDDGGCCPNLSCLPETEKEKFQYFLWRIAQ
jgi:hypothetical protein